MNRTITMNLGGIIFHIEEDAYDRLNKYLSTIKGYFKESEGCDEIMHDIEARIAEMLQGKVSNIKQAVLLADVEAVTAVMGKPEDFAGESGGSEQQNKSSNSANSDGSSNAQSGRRRRVFRDTDEKIVGGVCSGIANYFDLDPIWLRGAFAISLFVFGTGFLLYVILWIIIPEAKTTAEKLEMRGEKVDINNIGKAVNEEFEGFKKRMNDFSNDVKSPQNKERMRSTMQKIVAFIGEVLRSFIKFLGKGVAFFLTFIGIALMIGLLATIFGRGTISVFDSPGASIHFSLYELSSAILPDSVPISLVVIGIILLFGVPLISMIYRGVKFLFNIKQKNRIVKYTANVLWLFGLALVVYIGIQIGTDFSEEASVRQNMNIIQPKGNTLYVDLKPSSEDDLEITYNHHHKIRLGDWTMISKDENKFRLGYPVMNIVPSTTDNFELVAVKSAQGVDRKEAEYRAKKIDYSINQVDSTIQFSSYFDIDNADKLRGQDVKLVLKVPVNKVIFLSKRMEKIIFDIDNVNDALDSDMVNRKWVMTTQGLECIDCDGLENVRKHKIN